MILTDVPRRILQPPEADLLGARQYDELGGRVVASYYCPSTDTLTTFRWEGRAFAERSPADGYENVRLAVAADNAPHVPSLLSTLENAL